MFRILRLRVKGFQVDIGFGHAHRSKQARFVPESLWFRVQGLGFGFSL